MEFEIGDTVYYDKEKQEIVGKNSLRNKVKINDGEKTRWVDEDEVEKEYKFEEGEGAYYNHQGKQHKCIIKKRLDEFKTDDTKLYLIFIEEKNIYGIVCENELLEKKKLSNLKEGDYFYLHNGEKVRVDKVVFDDYLGVSMFLIRRKGGQYQLKSYDELRVWI